MSKNNNVGSVIHECYINFKINDENFNKEFVFRLRFIHSGERANQNTLNTAENKTVSKFVRKKFFRHHKKHNSGENSREKKFEIPVHEFEERFEAKPPPKNLSKLQTEQNFDNWFFRDDEEDLEAAETSSSNTTEVSDHYSLVSISKLWLYYNSVS